MYASYALRSNEVIFVFTAPYSPHLIGEESSEPHPDFQHEKVYKFIIRDHGLAVRAVTIKVENAGSIENIPFFFCKLTL